MQRLSDFDPFVETGINLLRENYPEVFERNLRARVEARTVLIRLSPFRRTDTSSPNHFLFSSRHLAQSFVYCTATSEEGMQFILGIEHHKVLLGSELVTIDYEHRSPVFAHTEDIATNQMMIQAHESGHLVLALIHSHPGAGLDANHPSSIDHSTQQRWEDSRRFISGIWSRDGYLRFFSNRLPFTVQVVGSHMEKLSPYLFRLKPPEVW